MIIGISEANSMVASRNNPECHSHKTFRFPVRVTRNRAGETLVEHFDYAVNATLTALPVCSDGTISVAPRVLRQRPTKANSLLDGATGYNRLRCALSLLVIQESCY